MLDMGEPVKVVDLARDMIRLSGLEVGRDIDICFTGMRPGEKLFEELFARGRRISTDGAQQNLCCGRRQQQYSAGAAHQCGHARTDARANLDADVRRMLRAIVPEYCPPPVPVTNENAIVRAVAFVATGARSD